MMRLVETSRVYELQAWSSVVISASSQHCSHEELEAVCIHLNLSSSSLSVHLYPHELQGLMHTWSDRPRRPRRGDFVAHSSGRNCTILLCFETEQRSWFGALP